MCLRFLDPEGLVSGRKGRELQIGDNWWDCLAVFQL